MSTAPAVPIPNLGHHERARESARQFRGRDALSIRSPNIGASGQDIAGGSVPPDA